MANELQSRPEQALAQPRGADLQPGYAMPRQQANFDGSRLVQFVRRNYKLFFAIVFVVVALAVAYTATRTKIYSTTATVLLDQRKQQVVKDLDEVVSNLPADSSIVDTEVQLLSSPGMAYQVARATKQVPNTDLQDLSPEAQKDVSRKVRDILDDREVTRLGLTYAIEISYKSGDPQQAQAMANAFAQTYINSQIDVRRQANDRARTYLQEEIVKLQKRVTTADAAVARYKAANGLTDTSAGGTLTEQEISSYNQALATARAQSAEDAQRLASAQSQLRRGADALGDTNAPGLGQLRTQEATISATVADLASRYGPNHPELVRARGQLEDVRGLIRTQSARAVASLQSEAQASAGRAGAIQGRLSSTEGALQRAGAASVQLHNLQMQLDAPQKLLEAYQARLAEISTQSGAETSDARIISLAPFPLAPSSPNWIVNMILGIGAGITLGLIAVIVRQLFSVGIATGEEVEFNFGVDFLAALPRIKNSDDIGIIDKVVDEPTSPFAEALRGLAASILFTSGATPRVVALCSAFAEEGKTTTSLALGRVLAMRGRRVLVIDCDMQRQSFYQRFGIGTGVGLVDVLRHPELLDEAIVADTRTPASFLPVGRALEAGQSVDEHLLVGLLGDLRERYDLIILDLPPVLQVAETRIFAALADTTVLLARWKHTSKQAIDGALAILVRARASVVGVALTQVPISSDLMLGTYGSVPRLESATA